MIETSMQGSVSRMSSVAYVQQVVGFIDWLGIPAAILAWSFALYVYLVAPKTLAARLLVMLLIVDGVAVISSHNNWTYVDVLLDLGLDAWWRIHVASDFAVIVTYLAFIGVTVNSPLARPFGSKKVRWGLAAGACVLLAAIMSMEWEVFLAHYAPLLYTLIAAVLTWGLLAAIHAWKTAPDAASRGRARAFTIAFGVRDVTWMLAFLALVAFLNGRVAADSYLVTMVTPVFYVGAVMIYVPLIAYGMLRTQLFDIDLRIKKTLTRSTLLAIFVAVFFLISGLAEVFLSDLFGNILGVVATAGLMLFLEPLQRAAQRLADTAMPGTTDTPEYEAFRKLQVYEATLHAAMENGQVPAHKRATLDALVSSLGIDPLVARRLEEDAQASQGYA